MEEEVKISVEDAIKKTERDILEEQYKEELDRLKKNLELLQREQSDINNAFQELFKNENRIFGALEALQKLKSK